MAIGGFNESLVHGMEDYDFWLSILELDREVIQLKEVYFYYRIKKVSPPMTIEGATRNSCERDAKLANAFIQEQYEQSGHTSIYMGEWHTHPESNPTPSGADVSSVIKIAHLPDNDLPFVILCIVGLESIYWGCVINGKIQKISVNMI